MTYPQARDRLGHGDALGHHGQRHHGAGNALAFGAFSVAKSIVSGNTPSVALGEI